MNARPVQDYENVKSHLLIFGIDKYIAILSGKF